MAINPQDIEGRTYFPVACRGGLNLTDSKFDVAPGSLQDCLNYESSDEGYSRSQGLLFYDGTYDAAVDDMWYITTDTATESTLTGTGFTLGGEVTYGTSSATVVFWNVSGDTASLGLLNVSGSVVAEGDTITDTISGATLALGDIASMATAPAVLSDSTIADTIAEYLPLINGTINTGITGQTSETGSTTHHGKMPGVGGTTGGFQFNDYVYGVRDYYAVGFDSGDRELKTGDTIVVPLTATGPNPTFRDWAVGRIASVQLISGSWANNDAAGCFILTNDFTASYDSWVSGTIYDSTDILQHNDKWYVCKVNNLASASNEPGIGVDWDDDWDVIDISLFESIADNDEIYATINSTGGGGLARASVHTANTVYGGALWKATVSGWEPVDTGYTLNFITGENAPSVRSAPLFVSNMLDVVKDEGAKDWRSPTSIGSSPYIAWGTPEDAEGSDNVYATAAITGASTPIISDYLSGTVDADSVPNDDSRVVGVEVEIEARASAIDDVVDYSVILVNTRTGAEWYTSNNRARRVALTTSDATYSYGGSTDLWGVDEILASDLQAGNIQVRIQYANNDTSLTRTAYVDNVTTTVHYVPQAEHVYIYDGTTDVSEADIVSWQITNGEYTWGSAPKPAGVMTIYNATSPQSIDAGMSIYTGPLGTGDLVATTDSGMSYNVLPSEAEMAENASMYETMEANFYADEDAKAIYGTTGASAGFSYNGQFFSYIRTPLLQVADKPRHVTFHVNMLGFAYKTGHVLMSTVGAPNDFSGANGGTSWGFRDEIHGILGLPGATMAVLTRTSTGTLTGTDPSSMSQKNVQPNSGAREYTLQQLIEPFFLDYYGVSTMSATQKYGDFDFGRVSDVVGPWLRDRLQDSRSTELVDRQPVAALAIRNKNQYRVYFQDGYIMTASLFSDRNIEFTWQHYDTTGFNNTYVPTFLDSTVLSTGRERAIMGTADGSMWIIDGANGIQTGSGLTEMDSYITLNPINLDRPEAVTKYHHVVIQGQFYGWQQIEGWADTNYTFDESGAAHETIDIGSSSNQTVSESSNDLDSIYLPLLADGYSIKLRTSVDGSKPHTLQALLFRATLKGTDRNRTEKAY